MFERFTDRTRRLIVLAQEESRRLKATDINPAHILLAFFAIENDGAPIAVEVLKDFGYSREGVEKLLEPGVVSPSGHLPFTDESKRVLECGLREALQLGNNYVATEHILLGMLRKAKEDPQSDCAFIFGDKVEDLRKVIVAKFIEKHTVERAATTPAEPAALAQPPNDYEAIHQITKVIDQLPRERRKAAMAYLRQYAKRTTD